MDYDHKGEFNMSKMEKQNMKKLEMQDLENVSGGVNYDNAGRPRSNDVCPSCGFPGLVQTIDWDRNNMEILLCPDCYNAYYRNAAGALVHHRRIMG